MGPLGRFPPGVAKLLAFPRSLGRGSLAINNVLTDLMGHTSVR